MKLCCRCGACRCRITLFAASEFSEVPAACPAAPDTFQNVFLPLRTGCCLCILRSHRHSTAEATEIAEVLNGACRYLEWPVFLHVVRTVSEWLACQKFTLRELQIPVHHWRTQGLFNEHFTEKSGLSVRYVRRLTRGCTAFAVQKSSAPGRRMGSRGCGKIPTSSFGWCRPARCRYHRPQNGCWGTCTGAAGLCGKRLPKRNGIRHAEQAPKTKSGASNIYLTIRPGYLTIRPAVLRGADFSERVHVSGDFCF